MQISMVENLYEFNRKMLIFNLRQDCSCIYPLFQNLFYESVKKYHGITSCTLRRIVS